MQWLVMMLHIQAEFVTVAASWQMQRRLRDLWHNARHAHVILLM
jgi:hypothetical protein